MTTMNVSLPQPMKHWVEKQTQSDRYSNASDYVRDLIRRGQDRQTKIAQMQSLVTEDLNSGPGAEGFGHVIQHIRYRRQFVADVV
jgi:antitoxin ParD1/3/4